MSAPGFFQLLLAMNGQLAVRRLSALRQQSRLLTAVILVFVLGYWVAGYVLFRAGFWQLARFPGLGGLLIDRMLYLFFAFLLLMLVFSNLVIGYSTIFKNEETQWMLTLPVRPLEVFRWKVFETGVLASWAFLFLSAPFLLAYGSVRHVSGWFYLKALLLFVPFTMIPAAVGSLAVLLVARFLHRRAFKWMLFGLGAAAVASGVVFLRPMDVSHVQQTELISVMNQLLRNSRLAVQPLLPSYWVASSIIAWGEGWAWRGTFFFLVLVSNALMGILICLGASSRLFYEGWSRSHSQGTFRVGVDLLDRRVVFPRLGLLERLFDLWPFLHPTTRALMVKDVRVFWRDTAQWSQFVIFFGLLGLYVLNLRNVAYDWNNEYWASFVAFLNLGASSMTLATLTTRFVFPQFSLEGRRLWLIGLVPFGLKRVLMEKFWLSGFCSVLVTVTLTLTSGWMLHLPAWMLVLFSATAVLMSFALCGIAVGIGALYPNFRTGFTAHRHDNPAKIVSGFGGTLCFVLSLVYITIVIGAEAMPLYLGFGSAGRVWGIIAAWLFVASVSLLAIAVPLSLALRRLENLEI
ncbi:hypothetical protein HQ590_01235 [bacterium]|nr:hypothetical protein [bacterium]